MSDLQALNALTKQPDGWYHMPETAHAYEAWLKPYSEDFVFTPAAPHLTLTRKGKDFQVFEKNPPKMHGIFPSLEEAKAHGNQVIDDAEKA